MNIRNGDTSKINSRRRMSKDFLPFPQTDIKVLQYLKKRYKPALVSIEAKVNDIARLQHSHWVHTIDPDVYSHYYLVDDDSGIVYVIVTMDYSSWGN